METLNDENGEEKANFDVRDFTTRHKHLSKRKKTLPVFDRDRDVNDLKVQLFCSIAPYLSQRSASLCCQPK